MAATSAAGSVSSPASFGAEDSATTGDAVVI